jgi:hypothetical protein
MRLEYAFAARLTDSVAIGPVDGVVRVDNYFDGVMTAGALAGARVRGVDQIGIRADGSVALDIRETIEAEHGAIAADVRGYAVPRRGKPDLHDLRAFALFRTAVPEYAAYNTAVVEVTGTVDMATREIVVSGRPAAGTPVAGAAGGMPATSAAGAA